ncbi:tyrosine-type recombinase/integrase [Francisella noatunensis]|uniref:tyrosine-type recombinase/integrase n=1 Tax=Francisella noatunensis TaxID=657445 RepID=UPI001903648A|nr:tyrosine-type recombinase/integrase [Francisella noatunensis]
MGQIRESLSRKPNSKPREFLTEKEVNELIKSANKLGRHGHRDSTIILIAYRHALRVLELIALRWQQIYLEVGRISVTRRKNGIDSVQHSYWNRIKGFTEIKKGLSNN